MASAKVAQDLKTKSQKCNFLGRIAEVFVFQWFSKVSGKPQWLLFWTDREKYLRKVVFPLVLKVSGKP